MTPDDMLDDALVMLACGDTSSARRCCATAGHLAWVARLPAEQFNAFVGRAADIVQQIDDVRRAMGEYDEHDVS